LRLVSVIIIITVIIIAINLIIMRFKSETTASEAVLANKRATL
jgi:hypothetical protein